VHSRNNYEFRQQAKPNLNCAATTSCGNNVTRCNFLRYTPKVSLQSVRNLNPLETRLVGKALWLYVFIYSIRTCLYQSDSSCTRIHRISRSILCRLDIVRGYCRIFPCQLCSLRVNINYATRRKVAPSHCEGNLCLPRSIYRRMERVHYYCICEGVSGERFK